MFAKDLTYAKLVMPILEAKNEIAASDDLKESINKSEKHFSTQRMKVVASVSAEIATSRAEKGFPTGDQLFP